MSQSIVPLDVVKTVLPEIRLNEKRDFVVLKGPQETTYKEFISSSYSTSSINWSAPPPSPAVGVSRKVMMKIPLRLTFTGSNVLGQNTLQGGYDGLRYQPISAITNVLSVTINNSSVSVNQSDICTARARFDNDEDNRLRNLSCSPSYLDQYQEYSQGVGTNRNPLGTYGDTSDANIEPRGSFGLVQIVQNNAAGAIIDVVLTEYFFLSPFLWKSKNKSAFIGVQNIDVNLTFNANLQRVWSRASNHPNPLLNLTVSMVQAPSLLFEYYTMPPTMKIPESIAYPYCNLNRYINPAINIASGAVATITSNNIQLQSIPQRILVYCRVQNSDLSVNTTDTFTAIEAVSVNFNNRSGLLSSASKQDLYHMYRKNGGNMSWTQWSGQAVNANFQTVGTVGGILALCPGSDLALSVVEAPGLNQTIQFQCSLTVKNVGPFAHNYSLIIITEDVGVFSIVNQRSVLQIGAITKEDVLRADTGPSVSYDTYKASLEGGTFSEDLAFAMKDPYSNVIKPVAKELLPIALGATKKMLGMGMDEDDDYGGSISGGVKSGGRMMTRKELKRKLRE